MPGFTESVVHVTLTAPRPEGGVQIPAVGPASRTWALGAEITRVNDDAGSAVVVTSVT